VEIVEEYSKVRNHGSSTSMKYIITNAKFVKEISKAKMLLKSTLTQCIG
jgi:hypothetical protein